MKPAGYCIYCGANSIALSDEHIVPYSFGGVWVLPKSSCADCARITSQVEGSLARGSYLPLRSKHNFPTYNPKKRPKSFPATMLLNDGRRVAIEIPTEKYPTLYPTLILPPPGILTGEPLSEFGVGVQMALKGSQDEIDALKVEFPKAVGFEFGSSISWGNLCRTVAKISHSFSVGTIGVVGYTPLLPSLILGGYPYISHLVGGVPQLDSSLVHSQEKGLSLFIRGDGLILVQVDLMGGRLPTYSAVVGKVNDWDAFNLHISRAGKEGDPQYAHGLRPRFMFTHDWVMAFVGGVRRVVRDNWPQLECCWPLLRGCKFEVYAIPPDYYLFCLEAGVDDTQRGPEMAKVIPGCGYPPIPPNSGDFEAWQLFANSCVRATSDDVFGLLLPVRDSGKNSAAADYEMFSAAERAFWEAQFELIVQRQLVVAQRVADGG
jgi:hypothetical protein